MLPKSITLNSTQGCDTIFEIYKHEKVMQIRVHQASHSINENSMRLLYEYLDQYFRESKGLVDIRIGDQGDDGGF